MKTVKITVIILLCFFFSQSADQQRFTVDRTGRAIQVDAFLLEWKEDDSKKLEQGAFSFTWDAVNTPQGLAGYIWYEYSDTCLITAVNIYTQPGNPDRYMKMIMDTALFEPEFYALDKSARDSVTSITVEWLIPWDSIPISPDGRYEIKLTAYNSCKDTLKPFTLSGQYLIKKSGGKNYSLRIVIQVISIAILLALFIMLKARAKRLNRR